MHSQNKMVTLHLKGVSLEEVIQSLKLQTDYGFFYNIDSKDIKKMTNISVDVKNMALEDVLLQILKETNLTYSIVNDVVILNTRNSIVVNDSVRKNHVLVGRVMDMNKEPLPGVTVRLENTSMGTATNFEGVFSFRLPVEKGKLILSFVGFKTKGVEFKLPSDTLKIVLEEEVENVEEVVVTGYFNKAKESFTGSEVTIETEELKKVGALSIPRRVRGALPVRRRSASHDPLPIPVPVRRRKFALHAARRRGLRSARRRGALYVRPTLRRLTMRHEERLLEELRRELRGLSTTQALAYLLREGLLDLRRAEEAAIRRDVARRTARGEKKCYAMGETAYDYCCSYEKVPG